MRWLLPPNPDSERNGRKYYYRFKIALRPRFVQIKESEPESCIIWLAIYWESYVWESYRGRWEKYADIAINGRTSSASTTEGEK